MSKKRYSKNNTCLLQHVPVHRTIYFVTEFDKVKALNYWTYSSSRSGLSTSHCILFNVPDQDEHNDTILEALALFIDKLLAKTYIDLTWP